MVKQYVENCKEREPILVRDVKVEDKYKNARDITFHRLEKENKIRTYRKGIYYKPKHTMFGELGIDKEQLIMKQYIKREGYINGYYTGPALWNKWSITTQVPNRTWIATNMINRTTELNELKVKLLKPKTIVDKHNYELLQILDVIDQTDYIQDINWNNYLETLVTKLEKLDIDELNYVIEFTKYYRKFVNNLTGALIEGRFKNTDKYEQLWKQLFNLKVKANLGKKYKLNHEIKLRNINEWGFY